MPFIDELKIHIKAGTGGNGVVRWRHEKGKEFAGPSGGDGGRGGDVYLRAVRDLHLLSHYRAKKEFRAARGEDGGKDSLHGLNGKDLEILLPVGSNITNLKTDRKISLLNDEERILLLKGGRGGRGNESYQTPINRSPEQWTPGKTGEEADFLIEIELVADIGLIGLPNAGKTSLLNSLTSARGKIGDYPFTTLEPNLGECFGYIISDIPGLIEGASEGKGLGHKFLRHIKRTKILAHLISLENDNVLKAYKSIRKELEKYDPELLKKKEIIVLTKTDIIDNPADIQKILAKMKKSNPKVFAVSLYDYDKIKELKDFLLREVSD